MPEKEVGRGSTVYRTKRRREAHARAAGVRVRAAIGGFLYSLRMVCGGYLRSIRRRPVAQQALRGSFGGSSGRRRVMPGRFF